MPFIGYSVHSLALVADSFHMLNDVISLLVGLWAVKVANQETKSKMYTYGVRLSHIFRLCDQINKSEADIFLCNSGNVRKLSVPW
jgi:hypothetical protein